MYHTLTDVTRAVNSKISLISQQWTKNKPGIGVYSVWTIDVLFGANLRAMPFKNESINYVK
jgi:hypothetical protein